LDQPSHGSYQMKRYGGQQVLQMRPS
jgi:hypothetical protein